jgi:hypothetical protein
MTANTTSRQASHAMALAVFLLGFAVFFWGLGYKLSLYDLPGSPSTHIAQAKLLSQKERPASIKAVNLVSPIELTFSRIVFSVFLIAALCLSRLSMQLVRILLGSNVDIKRGKAFLSSFFSFRPPPVSVKFI